MSSNRFVPTLALFSVVGSLAVCGSASTGLIALALGVWRLLPTRLRPTIR